MTVGSVSQGEWMACEKGCGQHCPGSLDDVENSLGIQLMPYSEKLQMFLVVTFTS